MATVIIKVSYKIKGVKCPENILIIPSIYPTKMNKPVH